MPTAATSCNPQCDAMEDDVGYCGVDRSIVASVGTRYLNARNAPRNAQVVAAYRQLQLEIDRLFNDLVGADQPRAVRVAFSRCHQPYASDKELIAAVGAHETLEITSAAAFSGRLHPLLSCEIGGEFDRFRAIHDLIGHGWLGEGFDIDGECAAWLAQGRLHSDLAGWALASEIWGVNSARWVTGETPELKAVLLDLDTLSTPIGNLSKPRRPENGETG
jgi:hypothetical protein